MFLDPKDIPEDKIEEVFDNAMRLMYQARRDEPSPTQYEDRRDQRYMAYLLGKTGRNYTREQLLGIFRDRIADKEEKTLAPRAVEYLASYAGLTEDQFMKAILWVEDENEA